MRKYKNRDENRAYKYLQSLGYTNIQYEPDGNIPPDFLVNNTIAIEVRRLNLLDDERGDSETTLPLYGSLYKNEIIGIDIELKKHIQIYSDNKTSKIAPYRNRYKEWWLILVNHIDYRNIKDDEYDIKHSWDKLLIIEPN